jgi:hypothetical protein
VGLKADGADLRMVQQAIIAQRSDLPGRVPGVRLGRQIAVVSMFAGHETNETDRKLQAACTHVLGVVIKHALIQPFRSVEVPAGEEARKR